MSSPLSKSLAVFSRSIHFIVCPRAVFFALNCCCCCCQHGLFVIVTAPILFFFYFIHVAVHCFILHCHLLYTRSAHNIWHSPSFPLNQFVCPCYLLLSNLMKLNFSINATPSTAPYDIFCFKNQSFLFWFFIWLRLDRNNQQIVAVNV